MMAQQRRIGALARTGKFEERGEFSLSSRERFSYRLAHGDVLQDFHHRHAEQNVENGKNTAQEQLFRDLGGKKTFTDLFHESAADDGRLGKGLLRGMLRGIQQQ